MSVWNYIGEFFLFRLLVDKFKKCTTCHDTHTEISGASIDRNIEFLNGTINEGIAPDDAFTDIDDNLTDDSLHKFKRKGNDRLSVRFPFTTLT